MAKTKTQKTTLNPGAAGTNGAAIASDALMYVGSPYVWGGAAGTVKGKDAGTDCSGFVNMVLGRDLGMAVPGYGAGQYTGAEHGGTVADYIAWGGATTLGKGESPTAGDLVCYGPDVHIGIATSATMLDQSSTRCRTNVGRHLSCHWIGSDTDPFFLALVPLDATV